MVLLSFCSSHEFYPHWAQFKSSVSVHGVLGSADPQSFFHASGHQLSGVVQYARVFPVNLMVLLDGVFGDWGKLRVVPFCVSKVLFYANAERTAGLADVAGWAILTFFF